MLFTLIIYMHLNVNMVKEFFYEHEKYKIEDRFDATQITLLNPKTVEFSMSVMTENQGKSKLTTSLTFDAMIETKVERDQTEKTVLSFKKIKSNQKINKRTFKNHAIQQLRKKRFEGEFHQGFFALKKPISFFSHFLNHILFVHIKKIPKTIPVGFIWIEKDERTLAIEGEKQDLSEIKFIKFLGYQEKIKVFKITHFLYLKPEFMQKHLYAVVVESLLYVKGDNHVHYRSSDVKIFKNNKLFSQTKIEKKINRIMF